MFQTVMDAIKEESVAFLFNLEVQVAPVEPADAEEGAEGGADLAAEAPAVAAAAQGPGAADVESSPDETPATPPASPRVAEVAAAAAAPKGGVELVAPGLEVPKRPSRLQYSAPSIDGQAGAPGGGAAVAESTGSAPLMYEGTPRNAKCPCGSGKTYKRCHGDPRNVA